MVKKRKIHYCLRGLLFIALFLYFFDECFLLEIMCLWLSHHGPTSRAGPHVSARSMVPTAILMGAVGGQEELSLGGHSGFQRKLYLSGARGSHCLESSDSWQTIPKLWPESSSGGTDSNRVVSLSEIFHALFHPTLAQCPVGLCPACACPPLSLPDSLHRDPLPCTQAATSSTALTPPGVFFCF